MVIVYSVLYKTTLLSKYRPDQSSTDDHELELSRIDAYLEIYF